MLARRRFWAAIGLSVVALALLVSFRHQVGRALVAQSLSLATGYHVSFGEMRLQIDHGAFINARVSRHGEPLLAADRIDIYYHLRDLLPASAHRFGFLGMTINRPVLTIIHHKDGSYNIAPGRGGVAGGAGGANPTPLSFYARIRDGSASLIDDNQYYKEARTLGIRAINADLSVKSDARTHYTLSALIDDTRPEPLSATGTIDYLRGYAIHHVRAKTIPIKAIGNYVINSPAARILTGTARDFDARIYALGISPALPVNYHVSARAHLGDGQFFINGLARPLDNVRGTLQVFDGGLAAQSLDATIAGVPLKVAGAIYNFSDPQFELGVTGTGPLPALKHILAFGSRYPLKGALSAATLIEGPIATPAVLVRFTSARVQYAAFPLTDATGVIALYRNNALIVPLRARYAGVALSLRGLLTLGKHVHSELALHYDANSENLPLLASLLPGRGLTGDAALGGTDAALAASGYIADARDLRVLAGLFNFSSSGSGTIGPFSMHARTGSMSGSYLLDRPGNSSAFWIAANDIGLARARRLSLPGVTLPQLPAIDGTLDSVYAAGGGSGAQMVLAGRARAHGLHVNGVPVDALGASFAGPVADLALPELRVSGPWGSYSGNAAYDSGGFATRGVADASLGALSALAGNLPMSGRIEGPVAFAVRGGQMIVQSEGAQFNSVSVRGIPVQSAGGTLAIANGNVRIYAAHATLAGADAVAAGSLAAGSEVAVATSNAGPQAARAFGLPLQTGAVAMVGTFGMRQSQQTFHGGVAISDGRASGFPISGNSDVDLNGDSVALSNATVIVGNTFGAVDGTVSALHSGNPAYRLTASVPAADVSTAAHTLHLPTYRTVGSFSADLSIAGRGAKPFVSGPFTIAAGAINGLNFENARASITADSRGVTAQNGHVLVGTTAAAFSASVHGPNSSIALRAPRADLSDFNDYFDTGDTLAGRGSIAGSVSRSPAWIATAGDVNVADFRYRRLPIGNTNAHWSSRNGVAQGRMQVGGAHGELGVIGNVGLAPSVSIARIVTNSSYHVRAHLRELDLSTWLPAFGFQTIPATGRVNADASVNGRYPALAISSNATMASGTLGRIPVDRLRVSASSSGSRVRLTSMAVQIPALAASGSGAFGLRPNDPIDLDVYAQSDNLPQLASNFTRTPLDVHGSLETSLKVGGTWHAPTIGATIDLTKASVHGLQVPQLIAALAFAHSDIVVKNAELTLAKGRVAVAGALPLELSPAGIGPPGAPFSFDFFSQGVDLSDFDVLLPKGTKLGGLLDGHVGINGTVRSPKIRGALALARGSYVGPLETVPISQTVAQLVFNGNSATIRSLHALLGRGTLDVKGEVAFSRGAHGNEVSYTADATTRGASLNFPAYGSGTLDSALHLRKDARRLGLLSGNATISNAVIPFAALVPQGGGGDSGIGAGPSRLPFNLAFDLGVTAAKNVAVRANALGFGVDIGGQGHVKLAGTLADPTLAGRFNSSGGTLTFVGTVFKIRKGSVAFDPANGVVPDLYAVATAHVQNPDPDPARNPTGATDVTITLTGPASNPNLAFDSNPGGYSRDQIIGLLTPLGAISGIAFDEQGNPVQPDQLRGAPAAVSAQPLPPGAVRRSNGSFSVGQEAFNILNAQFTRSLFAPIENILGGGLGLSDFNLTLDYSGAVGVSFRRPLRDKLYALYATTFGYPSRSTYGLEFQPNEFTAATLTFFQQNTPASVFGNQSTLISTNQSLTVGQPLTGTTGFSATVRRLFW
ncbi:MAG: hypothetical protein DLM50_00400 [Candidatus Meridianibacter frigidus]|nr:MAG: hypothetical protein DLM50_00400 [Candidatus Eremiobacteraeota bacterium]